MPQGATTAGSTLNNPLSKSISHPQVASVSKAQNGFVVSLNKVDGYGADTAIAKTVDEVSDIIKEYFN